MGLYPSTPVGGRWFLLALILASCSSPLTSSTPTDIATSSSVRTTTATASPSGSITASQSADPTVLVKAFYSALDRGDLTVATAALANDATMTMPWILGTCCRDLTDARRALQGTLSGPHGFKILELVAADQQSAVGRVEARTQLTADPRLGRAIVTFKASVAGSKIAHLEQAFDVSDPVTLRAAAYKLVVEHANAPPTPAPTALPQPSYRVAATPPNGDVPNAQWLAVDAPGGFTLLAAVRRPAGAGPFPVVVALHAGSGFTSGTVDHYLNGLGLAEAGFMVVAGCWYDGGNPLNPPEPRLIGCPNGPPYESSYASRLPYADALVRTARILPGADSGRVGLYGESQGGCEVVLLGSTGTRVQAIVGVVAPLGPSQFTRYDTTPISVVSALGAPLLILEGLAPDPAGRAPPDEAMAYEAEAKQLGKTVKAVYYPGVAHEDLTTNPVSRDDYKVQLRAFLKQYLTGQ